MNSFIQNEDNMSINLPKHDSDNSIIIFLKQRRENIFLKKDVNLSVCKFIINNKTKCLLRLMSYWILILRQA